MKISLKGYGENTATFRTKNTVKAGEPVCFSNNFEVCSGVTGSIFAGAAVNSKDGYACVQLAGYVTFTYSGAVPSVGVSNLVADGNGGVTVDETGRQYIVVDVDEAKSTVGIIL